MQLKLKYLNLEMRFILFFIIFSVFNFSSAQQTSIIQILGSTVNDKDWNENVGGGHLRADLSQLNNRDTTKGISYQWYADDVAVSGATSRDFIFEEHSVTTETIHLIANYTTLSGQQQTAISPTLNQLDWRTFSGGDEPSYSGDYPYVGIMESNLVGDNPTPFMATYSFSSSSSTHGGGGWYEDGYRASNTHSITSVNASDQGISAQEGTNILKFAATSDSKRVEWGNRNYNTRVQENQDVYVSQKIYLPSDEWDPITQYSTIIFQHKQYPGSDPNFEIRLSNLGDYKLYVRSPYSHYGYTGQKVTDYPIATLSPDTWHDLKIHLTPSQDSSKGQMTIYLDGNVIFSEQGTNLNDEDNTNDSFLKLGMYTQILDDRHYFVDAVEMATFLPSTVSNWVMSTDSKKQNNELIYPNPFKNQVFIKSDSHVTDVTVFDLTGKAILRIIDKIQIDTSSLSSGVFIFKIDTIDGVSYHKLVK